MVPVPADEHNLSPRCGFELVRGRKPAFCENGVVELEADHRPHAGPGAVGKQIEDVRECVAPFESKVVLEHAHDERVKVAVGEPGNDCTAGELDDFVHCRENGHAFVLGADTDDTVTDRCKAADLRRRRIGKEQAAPPAEAGAGLVAHAVQTVGGAMTWPSSASRSTLIPHPGPSGSKMQPSSTV